MTRDWPGNVRELENALVRALVMTRGSALTLHDLEGEHWGQGPDRSQGEKPKLSRELAPLRWNLDGRIVWPRSRRRHVERVLHMTKGNKSAAARILEVSRPTLNRMIKDYQIELP